MIPHADFTITRRAAEQAGASPEFMREAFRDGAGPVSFLDLCQGEPTEERVRHCIWALRFDEQPDAHRRRVCLALGMVGWVGDSGDKLASRVYATLQDWFRGNASDVMLRDLLKETSADSAACRAACYALHVVLAAHRSDQCYWLGFCAQAEIAKRGEGVLEYQLTAMRNIWSDPTRLPEHDKPEPAHGTIQVNVTVPPGFDSESLARHVATRLAQHDLRKDSRQPTDAELAAARFERCGLLEPEPDPAPEPEAPLDPLDVLAELKADAAMKAEAYTEADAHRDAQAYADSVRQAVKDQEALPSSIKAKIAQMQAELSMRRAYDEAAQAQRAGRETLARFQMHREEARRVGVEIPPHYEEPDSD